MEQHRGGKGGKAGNVTGRGKVSDGTGGGPRVGRINSSGICQILGLFLGLIHQHGKSQACTSYTVSGGLSWPYRLGLTLRQGGKYSLIPRRHSTCCPPPGFSAAFARADELAQGCLGCHSLLALAYSPECTDLKEMRCSSNENWGC